MITSSSHFHDVLIGKRVWERCRLVIELSGLPNRIEDLAEKRGERGSGQGPHTSSALSGEGFQYWNRRDLVLA
jgi:hypothetical protein